MSVYEYVDEDSKVDENSLTVDFYFDSDVTKDQAVQMIDMVVDIANTELVNMKKLTGHKPTMYALSPFAKEIADDS